MEKSTGKKRRGYRVEAYSRLLANKMGSTKALLSPEELRAVDQALSIVIVDPYLRAQDVRRRLAGLAFTHVVLASPKAKTALFSGSSAPAAVHKRHSIHLDRGVAARTLQEQGGAYSIEAQKNRWVFGAVAACAQTRLKDLAFPLYLVLLEERSFLLPLGRFGAHPADSAYE